MQSTYTLFLNGRDIYTFVIGLIGAHGDIQMCEKEMCSPDERLEVIMNTLQCTGVLKEQIETVAVVVGPGSATALRAILMTVNAWKAVRPELELVEIESDVELEVNAQTELLEKLVNGEVGEVVDVLKPSYEHAVRITETTRDVLKRKLD